MSFFDASLLETVATRIVMQYLQFLEVGLAEGFEARRKVR